MLTSKVFLTVPELAARWDVSAGSLANWRSEGKGPSFTKIGSRVLYPVQAIERFEHAHTRATDEGLALAG